MLMKELLELLMMIIIALNFSWPRMNLFILQQNINVFMKEIYRFENDLSLPLIDDMFQVRKRDYNLRDFQKQKTQWKWDNNLPCTSIMELSPTEIKMLRLYQHSKRK